MLLGQKDQSPSVDAIVANHPSRVAMRFTAKADVGHRNVQIPDDLLTINKPVLINIGKEDAMLPQDQLARVKEIFLKDLKDVPTHVENFEEGVHGFTIRADLTNEKEKKEQVRL
jgi:dienelactone hydrolase